MKKYLLVSALAIMLCFSSLFAVASNRNPKNEKPKTEWTEEMVRERINRLEEIKAMDLKSMTRKERRAIKKEVRVIEKEMAEAGNGGIYLSTTAVIIILVILIILL